jgi:hypothetical protein
VSKEVHLRVNTCERNVGTLLIITCGVQLVTTVMSVYYCHGLLCFVSLTGEVSVSILFSQLKDKVVLLGN